MVRHILLGWNNVDRTWNSGFFQVAGNVADFYVVHNYFGRYKSFSTTKGFLDDAATIDDMMTFMTKDIQDKGADLKPGAITEWNITAETFGLYFIKLSNTKNSIISKLLICK